MAATLREHARVGTGYGGLAGRWVRQRAATAWGKIARSTRLRQIAFFLMSVIFLGANVIAWAWKATPSTASLASQVRSVVAGRKDTYTDYAAISPWVSQALIAAEDEHFYQHHGVDALGLTRAAWDDLLAGRVVEGGSTLTEQLAKNAYLQGNDHSLSKKWQDMILALKIEQHYSKQHILELYLNLSYFGDGAYGIAAASQHYFGVAPARLDLAQAALLAGLVRAPSAYDPICHPSVARARQNEVLMQMVADGMITRAQAHAAATEPLAFAPSGNDAYCA